MTPASRERSRRPFCPRGWHSGAGRGHSLGEWNGSRPPAEAGTYREAVREVAMSGEDGIGATLADWLARSIVWRRADLR